MRNVSQYKMKAIGGFLILLGICFAGLPSRLGAAPVSAGGAFDFLYIGKYFEYIEDINGRRGIDDITGPSLSWKKSSANALNLGFNDSTYWFRFTVDNPTPVIHKYYFEISYPLLDYIELYIPQAEGQFEVKRAGDKYPFSQREIIDRNFIFTFNQTQGAKTYFLRIKTSSSLNFVPILWSPKAFLQRIHTEFPIFWLYYGAMFVMCIYHFFIFLSIRERSHLYYGLAITFWVFSQMTLNGFAFQFFWPNSIWWANHCLPILIMTSIVWACFFFRSYVELPNNYKVIDNLFIYAMIVPAVLWGLFSFFGNYALCIKGAAVIVFFFTIFVSVASIAPFVKGLRPARIFVVGYSLFAFGVILYILKTFGILPSNMVTRWSIQFGSACVVIVVSLGLADKINVMKKALTLLNEDLVNTNANLAIFKQFAETSGQGLNMTDLKGVYTYVNPSFCRMAGANAPEDIVGQESSQFYPELMRRKLNNEIYPTVINVGEWIGELQLLSAKGKLVPVIQSFFQIHDVAWQPLFFASIITDITEAKAAEQKIHKLNEELEHRVIERTKQYENANNALEASLNTLKNAQEQLVQSEKMAALGGLVAGVAHEINTPLGAGITAASLLEDKTREFRESYKTGALKRSMLSKYLQTALEASTIIHNNLKRAADLVKSFKQVAVDQSSEVKRSFYLNEYIHQVLFSLKPKYKRTAHTIEVNCPDDIEINSYPGVYSQILTNFIMNSLIHGFENVDAGRIEIDVELQGKELRLNYKDNGCGMDTATLNKIYDPFFTTKRGQGGTGLGMHVSYNLVTQSLGGRMTCASQPGKGVHFTLYLPLDG